MPRKIRVRGLLWPKGHGIWLGDLEGQVRNPALWGAFDPRLPQKCAKNDSQTK